MLGDFLVKFVLFLAGNFYHGGRKLEAESSKLKGRQDRRPSTKCRFELSAFSFELVQLVRVRK